MNIIEQDIFTCSEKIIAHQTNCQGVMGGGVALQLKRLYPEVFRGYYHFCKTNEPLEIFGTTLICEADNGKYIANLFGQLNYGSGLQTDYDKLKSSLIELNDFAKEHELDIALPYKIGCGLAGGDWDIVSKLIEEVITVPYSIYKIGE